MHTRARLRARALNATAVVAAALALSSALAAGPATADPEPTPELPTTETVEPPVETTTTAPPVETTTTVPPVETTTTEPPVETTTPAPTTSLTTETTSPPPSLPPGRPQVEVSGGFDKPSFRTGEEIRATIRIKNTGAEPASINISDLGIFSPDTLRYNMGQWGDLWFPGTVLAPGEIRETHLSGVPAALDAKTVVLKIAVYHLVGNVGTEIAKATFTASIEERLGRVNGRIFGDANQNGEFDQGEQLTGVPVELAYSWPKKFTATSDANGWFDFGMLPTVGYYLGGTSIAGWDFPAGYLDLTEEGAGEGLELRGLHPSKDVLQASIQFTKDSYQPGELAHLTLTLTNTGPTRLTDIVARCNGAGNDDALWGVGPGWGDLTYANGGVTIDAGQKLVLDVSEVVPQESFETGAVWADCFFGHAEVDVLGSPNAVDKAAVPGGFGSLSGEVLRFDGESGVGVAGVRLVLVNPDLACPAAAAETTTGADGTFTISNVPAWPSYQLYVVPPAGLKVSSANPTRVRISASGQGRLGVHLEEGTAEVPAIPAGCTEQPPAPGAPAATTTAPAPQARAEGELAETGASVFGLGAFGLLALLGGAAALFGVRRRRPTA